MVTRCLRSHRCSNYFISRLAVSFVASDNQLKSLTNCLVVSFLSFRAAITNVLYMQDRGTHLIKKNNHNLQG